MEPEVFSRITPNLPEVSKSLPSASEITSTVPSSPQPPPLLLLTHPLQSAEETGCEFTLFKEKGLVKLLDEAIDYFNKVALDFLL